MRARWTATSVDVRVNNAGIGLFGMLEDVTVESFDALVRTNFRGAFFLTQALAARTALGRVGEPAEIGDAIAALASDDMRWGTAERIEVSGGALL